MKKKKNKIGMNMSSGAEKVEELARGETPQNTVVSQGATSTAINMPAAQNTATYENIGVENLPNGATDELGRMKLTAAQKEAQAARRRVQRAVAQKEREERLEAYKREKAARAKSWREEYRAALEREKRQLREKNEPPKRAPGFGGWLAAVVSLGVITLALSGIVTVGAMDMKRTKDGALAGHKATAYELIGVMENVDNDLDRVRISASPVQQSRILTDLLVQARVAEIDLEKLPIDGQADKNLTAFINRVGAECERMLSKLRNGDSLNEKDQAILQNLYEINHSVRQELDAYAGTMTNQDWMQFMKDGESELGKVLEKVENSTLQ
ncbi:MAG: germination protein YpeB, partial [Clostridia bacterium]|nr:germination protein YpeB [Clostridia bacterium]